jgi:hypothetical protein
VEGACLDFVARSRVLADWQEQKVSNKVLIQIYHVKILRGSRTTGDLKNKQKQLFNFSEYIVYHCISPLSEVAKPTP